MAMVGLLESMIKMIDISNILYHQAASRHDPDNAYAGTIEGIQIAGGLVSRCTRTIWG
jgi:hypothetical protein